MGNGGSRPIGAGARANAAARKLARAIGRNANGNIAEENSDDAVDNGDNGEATNPINNINAISAHENANSAGNNVVISEADERVNASNSVNNVIVINVDEDVNASAEIQGSVASMPSASPPTFELDEVQKGIVYALAVYHVGGKDNFELLRRRCREDKQLLEEGVKLTKKGQLLIKFRHEFIKYLEKYITINAHVDNDLPPGVHVRNASLWTDDSTICNSSDDDGSEDSSAEPPSPKKRRANNNHGYAAHATSNYNASDTDSSEDRRLARFYRSDSSDASN